VKKNLLRGEEERLSGTVKHDGECTLKFKIEAREGRTTSFYGAKRAPPLN